MEDRYKEKRIYQLRISSCLTATSARYLFQIILPTIGKDLNESGGHLEKLAIGKKTYLLVLCNSSELKEIEERLGFVLSVEDRTNEIVNDDEYILDNILKQFNYVFFEHLYRKSYLKDTPLWFAQRRIMLLKDRSRKIDHEVVYNHQKKK